MLWEKTCNIPRKKVVDLKKEVIIYKIKFKGAFLGINGDKIMAFFLIWSYDFCLNVSTWISLYW